MSEIVFVSDAVEGTSVNLDGESLQKEQKEKHQRLWKWTRGVDRTEMRKEEKRLRCALLSGSAWSTERKYHLGEKIKVLTRYRPIVLELI